MKNRIFLLLALLLPIASLAQTGIIKGKVTEAGKNTPIPFATVAIDATTIGTQTDENGEFQISDLKAGFYNIKVSSVGYVSKSVFELEVTNSKPAVANIELEGTVQQLDAVEVKANPFQRKEESPISLRTIGVNEIQRYPGGNRDISRVIQSLPGVGFSTGFRNDLIIRGGSTAENKFYLDDIEIPNINHFSTQGGSGGPQGLINVDFIRDVNFYSSAFPANRGNTLSSAMDIRLRDGREDRWGGALTLGITDAALSVEGPLGKKKNVSVLASWRSSYYDWFFKLIGLPIFPNYNDGQLKIKWKITPKDELELLSLTAIDIFRINLSVDKTEENLLFLRGIREVKQRSYTNGAKYTHYFDKSFLQVVASRSLSAYEIDKYKDNNHDSIRTTYYRSKEAESKLRVEWTKRDNGWKFSVGGNYELAQYYNKSIFTGEFFSYDYESKLNIHKYGVFTQVSKSVAKERLDLSFGLRMDGNNYNSNMANLLRQVSPRLSMSYAITTNLRWNFNTGYYHETPAYTVLGYKDTTGTLVNQNRMTYMRNVHVVSGFEYSTNINSRVSVEGFYKQYFDLPFLLDDSIALANIGSDYGVVGNSPAISLSKGRSYGMELLYEQKLFKGWFAIVSYTLFWSQFQDKDGVYQSSSWDTRNIISVNAGKKLKKNWEVGARFRAQGGKPYTPYNERYSSLVSVYNANPSGVLDYSRQNSQRLPWFHQLDIRVTKKWYFKKLALELYLDIQNVYFHKQREQDQFTVVLDANNVPIINANDPTRYQTKYLSNTGGILQPALGIVITY